MSDLREKVWNAAKPYGGVMCDGLLDSILALFERSAIERERKAFVAGWGEGYDVGIEDGSAGKVRGHANEPESESARRYQLPKEEVKEFCNCDGKGGSIRSCPVHGKSPLPKEE